MRLVAGFLICGAMLAVAVGLILASQATLGVAILAVACCLLIAARIFQASAYHHELLRALADRAQPWRQP